MKNCNIVDYYFNEYEVSLIPNLSDLCNNVHFYNGFEEQLLTDYSITPKGVLIPAKVRNKEDFVKKLNAGDLFYYDDYEMVYKNKPIVDVW